MRSITAMNKIFFSLLVLITSCFSSNAQVDWTIYDQIVDVSNGDPKELSLAITDPFEEEIDKARAIYYWVTHNIAYDFKMLQDLPKIIAKNRGRTYTLEEIEKLEEDEIRNALKRKKGVCQQYSRIFQRLCEESGIKCEFIGGLSKNNSNTRPSGGFSHAWNAVQIGELWGLVDVTYGAGYLDNEGKFHYNFRPAYFCGSIESFNMNHLPEEDNWQLKTNPFTKEGFKEFPYMGSASLKYNVVNLNPQAVLIATKRGSDIQIEFDAAYDISEIKCWHEGSGYPVDVSLAVKEKHHVITIATQKAKSGVYLFRIGDEDLFSFRVTLK